MPRSQKNPAMILPRKGGNNMVCVYIVSWFLQKDAISSFNIFHVIPSA